MGLSPGFWGEGRGNALTGHPIPVSVEVADSWNGGWLTGKSPSMYDRGPSRDLILLQQGV